MMRHNNPQAAFYRRRLDALRCVASVGCVDMLLGADRYPNVKCSADEPIPDVEPPMFVPGSSMMVRMLADTRGDMHKR